MATIQSNGTGGGNWSAGASWNGGVAPGNADAFQILNGDTITLDVDLITAATDLVASTIDVGGTLICSTATGTYSILISGDLTVNGTLQAGTSAAVPLPSDVDFTIDFDGTSSSIVGSATGRVYFYCYQPTNYWIQLSAQEAAGQTELSVGTDVTSDAWSDGDDVIIIDTDGLDEEERIIDAGGIAAGAITVTAGLTNQKESGAYLALLTRNIRIIDSTDYVFYTVVSSVINCEIDNCTYGLRSCDNCTLTGTTHNGGRAEYTCENNVWTNCLLTNTVAFYQTEGTTLDTCMIEASSPLYQSWSLTVNDCIINASNGTEQLRGSVLNRCTIKGTTGCISSFSNTLNNCTIESTTGISLTYSCVFNTCTFSGTTAISNSFQNRYYNCDFSAVATENSGYNSSSDAANYYYDQSEEHDQVENALKAWCKGGIVTSQTVSPPTGYTIWYEHAAEDTTQAYPVFRQFQTTVLAGDTIEVEGYIRIADGENLTTTPPSLCIVDYFADPLVDDTQTCLDEDFIPEPNGGIEAGWQAVSVIWANQGDTPKTVLVRMVAYCAAGGATDIDECWSIAGYKEQIATILATVTSNVTVIKSDLTVNNGIIDTIASDLIIADSVIDTVASHMVIADSVIDTVASDLVITNSVCDTIASNEVVTNSVVDTIASDLVINSSHVQVNNSVADTIASDLVITNSVVDTVASDLIVTSSNIDFLEDLMGVQQNEFPDGGGDGSTSGTSAQLNTFTTGGECA